MGVLERIEIQPNFPQDDLTEVNARYLSLMMANRMILTRGHEFAKREYPIFRGTHTPILIASRNILDNPEAICAIDFGVTALEAMTLFVNANQPVPNEKALLGNISGLVNPSNREGVTGYFESAQEEFMREAPRTAGVISEAAARLHGYNAYMAVIGGAVARQFELDNIDD